MNTLWLIIIFGLIVIIIWFTRGFMSARHTDMNRRRKMARNRTHTIYPASNDKHWGILPWSSNRSLDCIFTHLESENSLVVLQRYIEVAREYQAPHKTLRLTEKRITQLEEASTKTASIPFMDYLFPKFRINYTLSWITIQGSAQIQIDLHTAHQ